MTLIEVMVAITIMSIITALVYGGFVQTIRNKERTERASDRMYAITATLERMVRELSSAYVSAHMNPSPSMQSMRTAFVGIDHGSSDRIDFTSFSHQRLYRDAKESDQCELSYFVTRHPEDSSRRVLARREQARIDDDPQKGGEIQIALEDVEGFELEYLDPLTMTWLTSWDTMQASGQPNRLPAQMKIRIKMRPANGTGPVEVYGTRVVLPITWGLNFSLYNPT